MFFYFKNQSLITENNEIIGKSECNVLGLSLNVHHILMECFQKTLIRLKITIFPVLYMLPDGYTYLLCEKMYQ